MYLIYIKWPYAVFLYFSGMIIRPSVLESEGHGLRIGLVDYNHIEQGAEIFGEAFTQGYDLLKLHCPANDAALFSKIERLGLPYMVAQNTVLSRLSIAAYRPAQISCDIDFEAIQIDDAELAYNTVYKAMDGVQAFYFSHPLNDVLFNKDTALRLHAEYIKSFITQPDPTRQVYFFKYKDEYIGFCAYQLKPNNEVQIYLGGIVPEYRKGGVAYMGYKKVIEQALVPMGITTAYMETQAQNTGSLNAAGLKGRGFVPYQAFVRVHLFPLAGYIPQKEQVAHAITNYTKLCRSPYVTGEPGRLFTVLQTPTYTMQAMELLNDAGGVNGYHYFERYG